MLQFDQLVDAQREVHAVDDAEALLEWSEGRVTDLGGDLPDDALAEVIYKDIKGLRTTLTEFLVDSLVRYKKPGKTHGDSSRRGEALSWHALQLPDQGEGATTETKGLTVLMGANATLYYGFETGNKRFRREHELDFYNPGRPILSVLHRDLHAAAPPEIRQRLPLTTLRLAVANLALRRETGRLKS